MKLYDFITNLESIQRRMAVLEEEKHMLTEPIIYDDSRLEEVYVIYENELSKYPTIKPNSIESRRIFTFIAVRLYCPAVFAKGNLKYGFRIQLAKVLNCENSLISHDFKDLTFIYKKYKAFRKQVDMIYDSVVEQITEK